MSKNKIFKLILSVLVLIAAVGCFFVFADVDMVSAYLSAFSFDDNFRSGSLPISLGNYEKLSQNGKRAYIAIFNSVESHPKYIKIPSLSNDEFNDVYFAVKNDNPDIICFSDKCNMISFLSATFVEISYSNSETECNEMKRQLDEKTAQIISQFSAGSDYDREKFVHDYIVRNCEYAETDNSSNAYGCIVENKAVCSGYSRAAMLLLDKLGVVSSLVTGVGVSPVQGEVSHMWNLVVLDGEEYHLDVTWDDPSAGVNDFVSYLYFNLTAEQISADHKNLSGGNGCTATKYNYFVYNGLLFDDYNSNVLNLICVGLSDNIANGDYYTEAQFSSSEAYKKAKNAIIDSNGASYDMYYLVSYISKNSDNSADTTHINFTTSDEKFYIKIMFDKA